MTVTTSLITLTTPSVSACRRAAAVAVAAGITAFTGLALVAPAAAGPAPGNAQTVIAALRARGDQVIVNGDTAGKPLSACIAVSVRVGRHIYNQVQQRKGPATRSLASHVMYVTVRC
ncbi:MULTISPECIES: hypothetical protein [Mycobacteriaceae]|uniref:hypothetical protein n=1 Tax=Mycobacteroides franklinii TaxID=948102 RepID=UPI000993B8A8|nr:Uncharacterised protein [Mycobacteroides abscessus subsp. bolletii]